MSSFRFTLPADLSGTLAPKAPVSILNHRLAVVQQTTLDQEVALDPGIYAAKAVLPDGSELEAAFRIEAKGLQEPVTMSRVEPSSFSTMSGIAGDTIGFGVGVPKLSIAGGSPMIKQSAPAKPRIRLIGVSGATGQDTGAVQLELGESGISIGPEHLPPANDQLLIRVERRGAADINIAAPISIRERATILPTKSKGLPIDVRLADPDADLLLEYLCSRRVEQVAHLLHSHFDTARELLREKEERPIAAIVGAYSMILVGPPPGKDPAEMFGSRWLNRWTENLANLFPHLIDSLCIRAEVLARQGEHQDALAILKELPSRGLPIFSFGMRILLDRLSIYRAAASSAKIPGCDPETIDGLLRRDLFSVAGYVDFDRALLTFTTNPDGTPGEGQRVSQAASRLSYRVRAS